MSLIYGKHKKPVGKIPSVIMINPKYDHNVGAALRAASCFGFEQIWFTGNRVKLEGSHRLPREERMKGYLDVDLIQFDYPFDVFQPDIIPVAVEITPNTEPLTTFDHPENAVYVFGPEDGSLPQVIKNFCHRFVSIPTRHCTNLSAAIYIVMYDRLQKRVGLGLEPAYNVSDTLHESRGWVDEYGTNI